jgi:hypothetical protein
MARRALRLAALALPLASIGLASAVGCFHDFDAFDPAPASAGGASTDDGGPQGAQGTTDAAPERDGASATTKDAALPASDAASGCGTDCRIEATSCAGTCAEIDQSCTAACTGDAGACLATCATQQSSCTSQCVTTCETCTSDEGCIDPTGCTAAAP